MQFRSVIKIWIMHFRTALITIAITSFIGTSAQTASDNVSITDIINKSGIVFIEQPASLRQRISRQVSNADQESEAGETKTAIKKIGGFRVQVFSDNNAKTAKNEARTKARAIASTFPQYPTYVVYSSPYWRLKVGDFHSQEEAEVAANQIKKAFPSYAREIRVVRDRINSPK